VKRLNSTLFFSFLARMQCLLMDLSIIPHHFLKPRPQTSVDKIVLY
jgi:hypothetical protein